MTQGIDSFTEYFKEYHSDYVVIGGLATAMVMHDLGFTARATKDIDLVVISKNNESFIKKLLQYIDLAGYKTRQRTDNSSRHNLFRFLDSNDKSYPEQIELFAIHDEDSEIVTDSHIIPIETPEYYKYLSAILLDTEYFNLLITHTTEVDGLHIATPEVLIPLKVHAHLNLLEMKHPNAKKHLNDIVRLATLLDDTSKITLTGVPRKDFSAFMPILEELDKNRIENILKGAGINNVSKEVILKILDSVYR